MKPLAPGLYDSLLTRLLRRQLEAARAEGMQPNLEELDKVELGDYLLRFLVERLRPHLRALPIEDQLALANQLSHWEAEAARDVVEQPAQVLKALYRGDPPQPPLTPLAASSLMMNTAGAPRLAHEIASEMANADRACMLVSFIQWRGWLRLKPAFESMAARGRTVRILTTTYMGATELGALEALAALDGVKIRISLDGSQRRLHAKAWLFERDSGFSSMYVGSANLSRPALEDGIEWTVKLSEAREPGLVGAFRGAFETLWQDADFVRFDPGNAKCVAQVRSALRSAGSGAADRSRPGGYFGLRPHTYQQAVLDRLEVERRDRGFHRNLVVAPTGTGKTMIAAFDYARQPYAGQRPRLLFLAHRAELLDQACKSFREVLRDHSFGEVLAGGEVDSHEHLFATIQSFHSRRLLERFGPGHWDYAVLDEAHHAPAQSYVAVMAGLKPKLLLGLTATPERMDGQSILPDFDGHIADEMRLWQAIERQYVAPFDYFGIADGVDLSTLAWRRGAYAVADLEAQYVGNESRAGLIAEQFRQHAGDFRRTRALGFCVSVAHANFMAETFARGGIPAMAVTGETPENLRRDAQRRLREREVNVLFTVDLYNEGVDIPEVDCVLFLRPTESATVFLQQLGRGLRTHTDRVSGAEKASCLVLDFIGNQCAEFRFDLRYRALLGGTRRDIERGIDTGGMDLPGNCYFHLDKVARRTILENLKISLHPSRRRLAEELRQYKQELGRVPKLSEFLAATALGMENIYNGSYGYAHLLEQASLAPGLSQEDGALSQSMHKLLHVNSVRRLQLYKEMVAGGGRRWSASELRLALMLALQFAPAPLEAGCELGGVDRIRRSRQISEEFTDLCDILLSQVAVHVDEKEDERGWPLFLHRRYQRQEAMIAAGAITCVHRPHLPREGVYRVPHAQDEMFFVTLDKSDRHFSPSTRYEDYAISAEQFHWQSQSTTSEQSTSGKRYRAGRGDQRFLLFVRARPREAYTYLGPVDYASHRGSRPMSITWTLRTPMPAAVMEMARAFAPA